jgi:NAD(P)-dependent dehydrogenase (short-subunit alcohol dehydrogenase family)
MPASCATSCRRNPGVRRRSPSGSPASAGRNLALRVRKKAASSWRFMSKASLIAAAPGRYAGYHPQRCLLSEALPQEAECMTKIALITGANKGIGHEIARGLAGDGITVLMGARDDSRGAAAAKRLRDVGLDVHFVRLDVTDPAVVGEAARAIEAEYGRLDILVNNAGISRPDGVEAVMGPQSWLPSGASADTVRAVFEVNVFGVVTVTNAMLPLLRRADAARIVNVTSEVGSFALTLDQSSPYWKLISIAYPVSKTAANMVTVQYAKELWDTPIKVNAVCPGYTATDLNNHSGFKTPAEGARIAVRLAQIGADGPTGGFFNEAGPLRW